MGIGQSGGEGLCDGDLLENLFLTFIDEKPLPSRDKHLGNEKLSQWLGSTTQTTQQQKKRQREDDMLIKKSWGKDEGKTFVFINNDVLFVAFAWWGFDVVKHITMKTEKMEKKNFMSFRLTNLRFLFVFTFFNIGALGVLRVRGRREWSDAKLGPFPF